MEPAFSVTVTEFAPEISKTVNVTELLEERHITCSVKAIQVGFKDYCSPYSKFESAATSFVSDDDYLWISIGDIPLSKKLKEAVRNKFKVDNGELLFKNWDQMNSLYPEVSKFKHLHGKKPAFVGFPLPKEDNSED